MTALATRRIDTWESFEARRARVMARVKAGFNLNIWQALDLFGAGTDLRIKDLISRVEALEEKLGTEPAIAARASAKRKPLRLSLVGDITKPRAQSIIEAVKAAGPDTPIRVTLDSKGGNLDAAYDIAHALMNHKADTHCHSLQDCSSAAVVLMLAAKKRTAEPSCSFVLHRPSLARRPGVLSDERIEGMLDNSAHGMARLLASRTGTDASAFAPALASARGKRLTSAEAVELGIIHGLSPIKGKRK